MIESSRKANGDISSWMKKATCTFENNLILSWLQRHNNTE